MTDMEPEGIFSPEMESENPFEANWGKSIQVTVCESCDWQFLYPTEQSLSNCPHCFNPTLVTLGTEARGRLNLHAPEAILPVRVTSGKLAQVVQTFAEGNWFPPKDLTETNLLRRMILLYLPVWLVDSSVQATWQAEAGFKYQVRSHRDRFDENRGGWSSQEVQETRVRWEARLGHLQRCYQNITVPALEEHAAIVRKLGQFDLRLAETFRAEVLTGTRWVACLPDRSPTDAWQEAEVEFLSQAARECQQACRADQLRNFTWHPEFSEKNWTLLLLPVYTTYYEDDEGKLQPLLINGQSGSFHGFKRASLQRAQKTSLFLLGIAVLVFILSLALSLVSTVLSFLLTLGIIGIFISVLTGLSALIPLAIVWRTNRKSSALWS